VSGATCNLQPPECLTGASTGYLLSKKEGRTGSPEKPLSGLGALSYRNYWQLTTFQFLSTANVTVTFEEISKATSMTLEDILTTLVTNDMITIRDQPSDMMAKRKRAQMEQREQGGAARQAVSRTGHNGAPAPSVMPEDYTIHWDRSYIDAYLQRQAAKGYLKLRPEKLKYTPFLVQRLAIGRNGAIESQTVAKAQAIEVQGEEPNLKQPSEPSSGSYPDVHGESRTSNGANGHDAHRDKDKNRERLDEPSASAKDSRIQLEGANGDHLSLLGEGAAPSSNSSVAAMTPLEDIVMEDVSLKASPSRSQRSALAVAPRASQQTRDSPESAEDRDIPMTMSRRNLQVARPESSGRLSRSQVVPGRRSTRSISLLEMH
jgi:hypothetical protein